MREGGVSPGATRVWRWLRRALPAHWRERYAADMLRTHVELAGGEERARGARFWVGVARDVVLTGVQVRLDGERAGWHGPRRPRRSPVDGLAHTLRLALRGLRRTPGFATAVACIFAIGIAANIAMFRVLDRVLLSPPAHVAEPDEVRRVHVYGMSVFTGSVGHSASLSYPDYRQLSGVAAVDGVAGFTARELTLVEAGRAEKVRTEWVTASYFPLLGAVPVVGRFFDHEDDRLGTAEPVAVLSHAYWQRRFGGSPSVIGDRLVIGRNTYTVVGVASRGFTGVNIEPIDVWLPLHPAAEADGGGTQWLDAHRWYMMAAVVRVAPAARLAAEDAATAAYLAGREGRSGFDPDQRVVLSPLIAARGPNASRESRVARMLGLLTVLVLLVTCANVGNLFLARVLARRREFAIQAALGVSKRRVSGQLLAEVAVLAGFAAVLALWLSAVAGRAIFRVLLPDAAPPAAFDLRVLLATLGIVLATSVMTGVLPAIRATRADVMDTLRQGRTSTSAQGARRILLMAQAALSVVLLVGAGLFIRSLQRAESVDFGLDRNALAVEVELEGGVNFGNELSAAIRDALPRLRGHPAVASAATSSILPFSGWWGLPLTIPEGDSIAGGARGPFVYGVSGDYFETVGLEIVRGRPIEDGDLRPGAPLVTVVNETLARAAWPGRDALGQCIVVQREGAAGCTVVVGVSRDIVQSLTAEDVPMVYYLPSEHPGLGGSAANAFIVQSREGIGADVVRRAVLDVMPTARYAAVGSIGERIAPQLRSWRLGASLLSAFGLLALIIAGAGLYSTLAFDVAQRRRELGVRAALGAPARRLVRSVVTSHLLTIGAGVTVGLILAAFAGRAAQAMLFRVQAGDPTVYAAVSAALLLAAVIAALLPAWSATRVDPVVALRED